VGGKGHEPTGEFGKKKGVWALVSTKGEGGKRGGGTSTKIVWETERKKTGIKKRGNQKIKEDRLRCLRPREKIGSEKRSGGTLRQDPKRVRVSKKRISRAKRGQNFRKNC